MSVERYVYIGPYLSLNGDVLSTTATKVVKVNTCTNALKPCINHQNRVKLKTSFCPDCGSPVNVQSFSVTEDIEFDPCEILDDILYCPFREDGDYDTFIPNQKIPGLSYISLDTKRGNPRTIPYDATKITKDCATFELFIKDLIEALKPYYTEPPTIEYGAIYYCS